MKSITLTKEESRIERALLRGDYVDVSKVEFQEVVRMITRYRKSASRNSRANIRRK